ncbi:MAG: hypothetical protein V3U06_09500 [Candidatus Binatia bacterium]
MAGRPAQLVSQQIENISSEALERYQNIVRRYVRVRQGVCAFYHRGKLYYVRLASNLRSSRLLKKDFSCFDKLSTNGKSSMFSMCPPFTLSPSTSLRTGLSKDERRVFQQNQDLGG